MSDTATDWDPGAYDRFRDLRLIPALDLLSAVGRVPEGDVVDLGCGSGAAAGALSARFCGDGRRRLIGVDSSAAMLTQAQGVGLYDRLDRADIALWAPYEPPALVFSNATLHWLADHAALLKRLAGTLRPGGWLAVQMPGQNDEPSHAAWRSLTGAPGASGIETPERYAGILAPLGKVRVWETRYYQNLPPAAAGHPVRAFTSATYARPFLEASSDPSALEAAYDAEMAKAYPVRADGSVLFPFRRVFFVLQKP